MAVRIWFCSPLSAQYCIHLYFIHCPKQKKGLNSVFGPERDKLEKCSSHFTAKCTRSPLLSQKRAQSRGSSQWWCSYPPSPVALEGSVLHGLWLCVSGTGGTLHACSKLSSGSQRWVSPRVSAPNSCFSLVPAWHPGNSSGTWASGSDRMMYLEQRCFIH